jgi:hypothetical protein
MLATNARQASVAGIRRIDCLRNQQSAQPSILLQSNDSGRLSFGGTARNGATSYVRSSWVIEKEYTTPGEGASWRHTSPYPKP